ncbi:hypothetical protein [uncultured Granulicatella sp.]|uniref:hypothetical protein n=1 Tax=uncultured Granulicatella sp. TaxID=316089 RepID=UPI0037DD2442
MIKLDEVKELTDLPKLRMIMEKKQIKPNFSFYLENFMLIVELLKSTMTAMLNLQPKLKNQKSIHCIQ